jgi:hypothetical protein
MVELLTAGNVSTLSGIMRYNDMITGGIFGIGLLLLIFVISFIAMRQSTFAIPGSNSRIFAACIYVTTFFSVMFFIIGILNEYIMYICIFLTAVAVFANLQAGR